MGWKKKVNPISGTNISSLSGPEAEQLQSLTSESFNKSYSKGFRGWTLSNAGFLGNKSTCLHARFVSWRLNKHYEGISFPVKQSDLIEAASSSVWHFENLLMKKHMDKVSATNYECLFFNYLIPGNNI